MKKVLGMAVLMMVMLVSVSGLAVEDSVDNIPVYLNVPEFVRLSVDPDDEDFSFTYNPTDLNVHSLSDTVALVAEANVGYTVDSNVGYQGNWGNLVNITIDTLPTTGQTTLPVSSGTFGSAGVCEFEATANLSFLDLDGVLSQGILTNAYIADVTFTISSN